MSPGGQRASAARIAANRQKGRLGSRSRLRFRGLARRFGQEQCQAGPPQSLPAARGSPVAGGSLDPRSCTAWVRGEHANSRGDYLDGIDLGV